MNAYFQHLIERNTPREAEILPRVPSLFEAGENLPAGVESNEGGGKDISAQLRNVPATASHLSNTGPNSAGTQAPLQTGSVPLLQPNQISHASNKHMAMPSDSGPEAAIRPSGEEPSVFNPQVADADRSEQTIIRKTNMKAVAADSDSPAAPDHADVSRPAERSTILSKPSSLDPSAAKRVSLQTRIDRQHPRNHLPSSVTTADIAAQTQNQQVHLTDAVGVARPPAPGSPYRRAERPDIRPLESMPSTLKASASPAEFQHHPVETEKTIKVTIGRIEVRAILPQTPAPPVRAKEAQPQITLEDYLKKQRGGSR